MKEKVKIISIFLTLALLFNIIVPTMSAAGEGEFELTVDVGTGELTNGTVNSIKVNGETWSSNSQIFKTTTGQNAIEAVIEADDGYEIGMRKGGNSTAVISEPTNNGNTYTFNITYNTENIMDNLSIYPYSYPKNNGGNNDQNSNIDVQFDSNSIAGNVVTYNVNNTDVTVTVVGTNISDGRVEVDRNNLGGVSFTLGSSYNDETMQVVVRGSNSYNTVLNVNNGTASLNGLNIPDGGLHLSVEPKNTGNNDPQNGDPQNNDPQNNNPQNNNYNNIQLSVTFNNTSGEVLINNTRTPESSSYNGTLENAGFTESDKINKIIVNTSFGEAPASKVTINGIEYNFNPQGYDVAGAESYTIVVEGNTNVVTPKTVIWTNPDYKPTDEEDAAWASNFRIDHGYARVVEVYDKDGNKVAKEDYIVHEEGLENGGVSNGFGMISIIPGSRVVFEFVPEYGYQLTKITINEHPLEASSTMNRFEFTMANDSGNIHFGATFTKTEDVVKANSEKVASGSIELGNTLPGGSAQLTVSDVELSSDKIAQFENAAGDYKISNYLDIDLYNVYYKGKADSEDVWLNKISELANDATISIKLENGVNAEDIVIVHNVHDGDKYEVIPIESYDAETNTITFKTKSFSNYAIAAKEKATSVEKTDNDGKETGKTENEGTGKEEVGKAETEKEADKEEAKEEAGNKGTENDNSNKTGTERIATTRSSNNPQTGDMIVITTAILFVAVMGIVLTVRCNKKGNLGRH